MMSLTLQTTRGVNERNSGRNGIFMLDGLGRNERRRRWQNIWRQ